MGGAVMRQARCGHRAGWRCRGVEGGSLSSAALAPAASASTARRASTALMVSPGGAALACPAVQGAHIQPFLQPHEHPSRPIQAASEAPGPRRASKLQAVWCGRDAVDLLLYQAARNYFAAPSHAAAPARTWQNWQGRQQGALGARVGRDERRHFLAPGSRSEVFSAL